MFSTIIIPIIIVLFRTIPAVFTVDCSRPGTTLNDTFSLGVVDGHILQYNFDDSLAAYPIEQTDDLFRLINGRITKFAQIYPVLMNDEKFSKFIEQGGENVRINFAVQQSLMEPLYIFHILNASSHRMVIQSSTGNDYYFIEEKLSDEHKFNKMITVWSGDYDANTVIYQINYLIMTIDVKKKQTFVFNSLYLNRKPYGMLCFVPNSHGSKIRLQSSMDGGGSSCESITSITSTIDFAFMTKGNVYMVSIKEQNVYQFEQSLFYIANNEKDFLIKNIKDVFSCAPFDEYKENDDKNKVMSSKKRIVRPQMKEESWFIFDYKMIIISAIFALTVIGIIITILYGNRRKKPERKPSFITSTISEEGSIEKQEKPKQSYPTT